MQEHVEKGVDTDPNHKAQVEQANRGYVTAKYQKDNEYFVDLIWWCETFDKYIVQEGFATVKLPKKG